MLSIQYKLVHHDLFGVCQGEVYLYLGAGFSSGGGSVVNGTSPSSIYLSHLTVITICYIRILNCCEIVLHVTMYHHFIIMFMSKKTKKILFFISKKNFKVVDPPSPFFLPYIIKE